jgi:hypothetical protein
VEAADVEAADAEAEMSASMTIVSRVVAAGALALAALGAAAGCSDRPPTEPGRDLAGTPLLVSEPVAPPAGGALGRAAPAAAAEAAYVSLPPGAVPGATTATIRNLATGASLTVPVVDGGFDPVPVASSVGDELAIEIRGAAGVLLSATVKVPPRRPPKVVRVDPPKGKTDVPLNSRIIVVFSEPVDPATLTTATVQLLASGQPVAGAVQVNPSGLTAEFVPQSLLAANTTYELAVTTGVRDLSGDALEAPAIRQFPTGTAVAQSLWISVATADPDPFPPPSEAPPYGVFTVEIRTSSGRFSARQNIAANGWAEFRDVPAGDYTIALSGMASRCRAAALWSSAVTTALGSAAVTVPPGERVSVAFAVTCEPFAVTRLPPGTQLAFVRDGRIYLVNSDGTGLVRLTDGPGDADPAWSPDGRIAFTRSGGVRRDERGVWFLSAEIYIMDADGSNVVQRTSGGYDREPTWSPDGREIAFAGDGGISVISADDDGTSPVRLAGDGASAPAWSPDASKIAFAGDDEVCTMGIFVTTRDGAGVTRLTNAGCSGDSPWIDYNQPAWSRDGRKLAVVGCVRRAYGWCPLFPIAGTISVMNADGSGLTSLPVTSGLGRPAWSPDGRTIAFAAASGSVEWVRADGSEHGLIVADGHSPAWRR